jgi:putative intracellular protease/amidase
MLPKSWVQLVGFSFFFVLYHEFRALKNTNTSATDAPAPGPWDDFHVVDGRVVTGTNPASANSTAKAILEVFKSL